MPQPSNVTKVFERLSKANPEPKGELHSVNSYTLLVAVVLSAQATDKGVNKATKPLFEVVKTPAQMIELGADGLLPFIKSIGLFRNKAKNIIALSQALISKYEGRVPQSRQELEDLPGVGRKTANVVLNIAFGQPTIAVDTHVFRVSHRLGLAKGKTPPAVEDELVRVIPEKFKLHAHHWLILHGRYVCVARTPKCPNCILFDVCSYKAKTKE